MSFASLWLFLFLAAGIEPQQSSPGAEAFKTKCSSCHGANAKGTAAGGDLTGLWTAGGADQQIYQSFRRGLANTLKPHSFGPEKDMGDILAYLRTLDRGDSAARPAGNAENGERVFRANCSSCHQINDGGGRLGPDLSKVGAARSRPALAHKIRHASSYIFSIYAGGYVLEGYQPVTIVTRTGERVRGVKKNEDAFSIQIMDTQQRLQGYLKSSLRELINDETSLMPDFSEERLSNRDLDDLLSYLGTLR